jgi:hypothetical protein
LPPCLLLLLLRPLRLLLHQLRQLRYLLHQRSVVQRCRRSSAAWLHHRFHLHGLIGVGRTLLGWWQQQLLLLLLLLLLLRLCLPLFEFLHQLRNLPAHARCSLPRRLLHAAPFDLVLLTTAQLADAQHALRSLNPGRLLRSARG